ncbi:Fis family transcriptional regulator, partial [bacterium]|nr:Fis family transcriptional regulator [bacterium]
DLYYRINGFPIMIPPLRERKEDIPELTRFFVQKYARRLKKQIDSISSAAMQSLMNYHWPGNIRELEHFIERAVIVTRGSVLDIALPELLPKNAVSNASSATLEESERQHILQALKDSHWVIGGPAGAAARLAIKRTTLQARMRKLGITRPR